MYCCIFQSPHATEVLYCNQVSHDQFPFVKFQGFVLPPPLRDEHLSKLAHGSYLRYRHARSIQVPYMSVKMVEEVDRARIVPKEQEDD